MVVQEKYRDKQSSISLSFLRAVSASPKNGHENKWHAQTPTPYSKLIKITPLKKNG